MTVDGVLPALGLSCHLIQRRFYSFTRKSYATNLAFSKKFEKTKLRQNFENRNRDFQELEKLTPTKNYENPIKKKLFMNYF